MCVHIIQSVNTETVRMKDEWETVSSSPPPPKPSRQTSIEAAVSEEEKSSDTYCYELLSMLTGLSQSEVGCSFLSEQEKLMQDLFTLLHVGSTRLQLQVGDGPVLVQYYTALSIVLFSDNRTYCVVYIRICTSPLIGVHEIQRRYDTVTCWSFNQYIPYHLVVVYDLQFLI